MAGTRNALLRRFWGLHSRGWDQMRSTPESVQQIDAMVAAFATHIPSGARVLDLGCGAGHHAIALARRGFDVTAVDYAPAMLDRARAKASKNHVEIDFRVADLNEPLPFATDSFDGALCISVLQVVAHPEQLLVGLRNTLRPNGAIAIELVRYWGALSPGTDLRAWDRLVNAAKVQLAKRSSDVRRYTADDVARMCKGADFEVVSEDTNDRTFVVTARRAS